MTPRPVTLLLAGTLAAACSKPNPLFLDTWGEVSDSGGQTMSGASTLTGDASTATASSTTVTTPGTTADPPTTGPSTMTSGTGTSGVWPTSDATTDDPFYCVPEPSGCCEVRLQPEADNFFTDAIDGVNVDGGCPFVADKPQEFEKLACGKWSFGKVASLRLLNDDQGEVEPYINTSAMALRFPLADGELVVDGKPLPWSMVELVTLELSVMVDWAVFSDFKFDVYGLPAHQMWVEGEGDGAVPCVDGNSCYFCAGCGGTPNEPCATQWDGLNPYFNYVASVEAVQGPNPTLLELPIGDHKWLSEQPAGLVLLPSGVSYNGMALGKVPSGAITAHSRESNTPPALRLKVCMN